MLTGKALFPGDTVTDVIAAVVTKEPDLDALPGETPLAVRWLLARCLRKDPRKRLPDIGAARLALQDLLAGTAPETEVGAAAGALVSSGRRSRQHLLAGALALATALAASLAVLHFSEVPERPPVTHFVLDFDELGLRDLNGAAVSPDGRSVVFEAASSDGTRRLWMRRLDSPEIRALPGTEGGRTPFWSPDGAWLAFAARTPTGGGPSGLEVKKLNVSDGTVHRICAVGSIFSGAWGADGTILLATNDGGALLTRLLSVPAAGGEAKPFLARDESRGETRLANPQFLPDGRHFLFSVGSTQEEHAGAYLASIDAPEDRRRLLPGELSVAYASGHLLFVRDGVLLAQPFDTRSLEVSGEPVSVAGSVQSGIGGSLAGFGWFSASPTLVAHAEARGAGGLQLTWVDRKGEPLGTLGEPGSYGQIVLSPDERRVAVEIRSDEAVDLWTIDVARGVASRLTNEPGSEVDPVWSPDSQELVYGSTQAGEHMLFRKGLRGEPAAPVVGARGTDDATRDRPEAWSPDGKVLLCKKLNGTTVWALPLEGGGDLEPVVELGYRLDEPAISPDGRWLAYTSEETGTWEVYLQPFRRPGERVRVSVDRGGQPEWRGDGRELFFRSLGGRLMAVDVKESAGALEVGLPTALFAILHGPPYSDRYAVSADGQRFLVQVPVERGSGDRLHVIANWASLLETRD